MKNLYACRSFLFFYFIIIFSLFLTSCDNGNTGTNRMESEEEGEAMEDFDGALQYEFNMVKDPQSGKIPVGIRDQELTQARQIFTQQQINGRIQANTYSFQGPNNMGGRTRTIVYDVRYNGTSNRIILAGGISGGLFKSTDDGATWTRKSPIGDLFSVTCLVQDPRPTFQDTWYYAGGEAIGNSASATGASYRGKGVYKSTDNGETWSLLPASNTGALEVFDHRADYVTRLAVDPTNGNVYMAVVDAIYRSTNGGTSWFNILTSGNAGFGSTMTTDIVITSTGKLYAAFAGGSNTGPTLDMPGVWSSTTGAAGSWTKIAGTGAATTPATWNADGAYGRVVLGLCPSLETRLFAVYYTAPFTCAAPAPEAELFRWDDGLSTWTDLSANLPDEPGCLAGNDPFAVQSGYDLVLAIKPDDPDAVFLGGTNLYRSTSGFTTTAATTRIGGYASPASFALYTNSHSDIHTVTFSPTSAITMLCGNDGGIQRTIDNLASTVAWTQINIGYRTYQYYYVDIDPRMSNTKVIGGAQDNGTTRNIGGAGTDFESVFSGDGVSVGLSDLIGGIQYEYVGTQQGSIRRRNATSGSGVGTTITPTGEGGTATELFVTLFKLDPDNSEILYYANDNVLYRTTSASTVASGTWTSMSGIATSVGAANDITAIALTRGTYSAATSSLFFGTSNGKLFRLDDPTGVAAATSPVDITGGAFPAGYISSIAVNPRNDDTILVTFSNYGVASVFWTGNANSATPTWTNVEGALTLPSYRSSVIAVTNTGVQYFVGTSVGLYNSTGLPGSVAWAQEGPADIGNALVSSLVLRPSDNRFLIGTHGYGMWTTSSLTVLPIILTEFKGTLQNNKNVLLQWATSSEYNSKYFEVERSSDGISFKKITIVPAAGSSINRLDYSYVDKTPLTEYNYYRLRSVDVDEKFKLSNTVLIKVPNVSQGISVLGNPFRDNITVQLTKQPKGKVDLRLYDISGRLIVSQEFSSGLQLLQMPIPPEKVRKGSYLLKVTVDGTTYTSKVLKQ